MTKSKRLLLIIFFINILAKCMSERPVRLMPNTKEKKMLARCGFYIVEKTKAKKKEEKKYRI